MSAETSQDEAGAASNLSAPVISPNTKNKDVDAIDRHQEATVRRRDSTLLTLDAAKLKLLQQQQQQQQRLDASTGGRDLPGNPQPFFPVAKTPRPDETPTSYQFPVIDKLRDSQLYEQNSTPTSTHVTPKHAKPKNPPSPSKNGSAPASMSRSHAAQQLHHSMPDYTTSSRSNVARLPARVRRQSTTHAGYTSSPTAGHIGTNAPVDATNQLEAKVVILGSQGVGKTSIVHRYTSGQFSYSLSSTIGASFLTKKLVVDGCKVRLQIWDTAGQERFRSMAPLYYRGALAAILVYDITNEDSFEDIKVWLDELRRNMSPDLIIHVVGSKADLASTLRQVDLKEAKRAVASWVMDEANAGANDGAMSNSMRQSSTHKSPTTMMTSLRDLSPPSPSRPRAYSRRGSLVPPVSNPSSGQTSQHHSSASLPTITTSGPGQSGAAASTTTDSTANDRDSLGARVRTLSSKLGQRPTLTPSHSTMTMSTSSTGNTGVTNSAASSVNDLNVLTTSAGSLNASSNAAATSSTAVPPTTPPGLTMTELGAGPASVGMSKSSSKFSLSFYGSGLSERGRKNSAEEDRRQAQEAELARLDDMVDKCGVDVTEVSAKDDFGIEDVFLMITTRLVERKQKIEHDRVLRSRDSIMLRDNAEDDANKSAAGGWCCA
ncbi:hypothetical protein OIO90_006000 [Microbotryomycetes sp. JL221]|nr:hypothetical protein OIO90_006000 [Microbotryomycetes sp. JL221]